MKLASFTVEGQARWGQVEGERIRDLSAAAPSLRAFLAAGGPRAMLQGSGAAFDISAVRFQPVVPDAPRIFCVGLNYEEHRRETGRDRTDYPTIFVRFADCQVGHGEPILRPMESSMLDYEGELGVVIGTPGRRIAEAEALDHVAGYCCCNDASVRDWQRHTSQFTPGKNFPATGASGPWLVTTDEISDPQALSVTTRLNGVVVQSAPTADMIFPVARVIAYLSRFTRLQPGDVIMTGTPGGVGMQRRPPLWMKAGDVVEVDISGVGVLRNPVRDEA